MRLHEFFIFQLFLIHGKFRSLLITLTKQAVKYLKRVVNWKTGCYNQDVSRHLLHHILCDSVCTKVHSEPDQSRLVLKPIQDSAEFLSGFGKKDRLTPVVSITMYWGVDEWDAPKSLHEMFGELDETLRPFIPDYRINLVTPALIDDFAKFKTELGAVLEALKYSIDKNKFNHLIATNKKFKALDNESVSVINLFAGAAIPLNEKEGVTDVCQAIEELKQDYADEKLTEELVKTVDNAMKNFNLSLEDACKGLGYSLEKYQEAKQLMKNKI